MATRILAIDDSRTIRMLLSQVLEEAGYEIVCAEDGIEGVARFSEVEPDIVITDINMPNLDGFGVISQLRGGDVQTIIPILVLTTESSPELKERARDLGATGWIVKPFDDQALIKLLQRVAGHA